MNKRAKIMTYLSLSAITFLLSLLFGDSQWKWCYMTQAYFLKQNEGKALKVPENYTGIWKSWYRNGNLQAEDSYEFGKLEGQCKWYYESGNLRSRVNWRNDQLDGKWIQYYDNPKEQMEFQKEYSQGLKNGEFQYFDSHTELLKMINLYEKDVLMRQTLLRGGRTHEVFDRVGGIGDENRIHFWGLDD